ncbi:MAG: rhomboid family intramembrane serine protease [Myxococcota bacterium]
MVRGLLIANVVLYVAELILLRTGASFIDGLFLSPFDVLRKGMVWQVGTYMWFHDPVSPGHLLFNMLWLYIFGTQMEAFWGPKRFLRGYLFFGLGGGLLTVLLGALAYAPGFSSWLDGFQHTRHLGASGAVIGVTVAWGLAHAKTQVNFFLLGAMSGMTFVFLIIGIQLLTALSFSAVSASAHFGGIGAAFILCRGLWRPSRWKQMLRRLQLKRQKRKIQRELRLIRSDDDDKTRWN